MGLKKIRESKDVKNDHRTIIKKLLALLLENKIITKEESDSIMSKGE